MPNRLPQRITPPKVCRLCSQPSPSPLEMMKLYTTTRQQGADGIDDDAFQRRMFATAALGRTTRSIGTITVGR
ncbi:Uncharacterised protein [Pseudomonas aeruginosa]|nr:Uncharacterised protein [Pseudomonas aeruginosa]